jgi:hypothetical protein
MDDVPATRRPIWWRRPAAISTLVAFAAFGAVIFSKSPMLLEPDDYA